MPKLPVLKAKQVVRILRELGFAEVRQKGSHRLFMDGRGRKMTVPIHDGADLKPGYSAELLSLSGISLEEFVERFL